MFYIGTARGFISGISKLNNRVQFEVTADVRQAKPFDSFDEANNTIRAIPFFARNHYAILPTMCGDGASILPPQI